MEKTFSSFDGINNVTAPYKVQDNLGIVFKNIDTNSKTLKSAKGRLDTGESMGSFMYWYKASNYDVRTVKSRSLAYINGYLYSTFKGVDSSSKLERIDVSTNTSYDVGISTPQASISVSDTGDYYVSSDFTYAYYYYAITYYDSVTGEESTPQITQVFGATKVTLVLDISNLDTQYDKLRIYRVGNYVTKFSLVDEIDNNSETLHYEDSKPDTALTLLLGTKATIPPPQGMCNLVNHQGTFYASVGSRLRFSVAGNASSWQALSFIDLESDIIGLSSVNGLLVIFLRNKVMVLAGTDIYSYVLLSLMANIGCVDTNTIATFRNFVVFMSDEGLVITDGTIVKYVTRDIYTFPKDLIYKDSEVVGDKYFLLTDQYLYEMDFRGNQPMFSMYDNIDGLNSITGYGDTLYGCATNKEKMFKGSNDLVFDYTTKYVVGTNYNHSMEIDRVSTTYTGNVSVSLITDSDTFTDSGTSSGVDILDVVASAQNNESMYAYINITGSGEVYAVTLDYDVPEINNG